jgi:cytochrome c oxidase subunit 2
MMSVTKKGDAPASRTALLFAAVVFVSFLSVISCYAFLYSSNGERVYLTGANDRGERIPFSGGPRWLYMHGGGCVECHGEDGRGGRPVMMLGKIPPDIRYETLISGEHEEGGKVEHHKPYNDELIIRAIREGLDEEGDPLDPGMPRWQLSDRDVRDIVEYLKTLK